jgi:hypothetical protein
MRPTGPRSADVEVILSCSLSPVLRGEGWGRGACSSRITEAPSPLSPEPGRDRPAVAGWVAAGCVAGALGAALLCGGSAEASCRF